MTLTDCPGLELFGFDCDSWAPFEGSVVCVYQGGCSHHVLWSFFNLACDATTPTSINLRIKTSVIKGLSHK